MKVKLKNLNEFRSNLESVFYISTLKGKGKKKYRNFLLIIFFREG